MPLVSPEILQLVAGTIAVHVMPLLAVIKYELIGFPPSSAGGVNETTVEVSPASTCKEVGAPGGAAGVAVATAVENADSPIALIASTESPYSCRPGKLFKRGG